MKFEAVPGAWALTYLKIMRGMSDGCYLLYPGYFDHVGVPPAQRRLPEQEAIPP